MFDEKDFLRELSRDDVRTAAAKDFLEKMKVASNFGAAAKEVGRFVKSHSKEIGGALVGAALVGGAQYAMNKPKKGGKPSGQQEAAQKMVDATKDPKGFSGEMAHVTAKTTKDISDVAAKYPGRSALTAAPMGAAAGVTLVRLMQKLRSVT